MITISAAAVGVKLKLLQPFQFEQGYSIVYNITILYLYNPKGNHANCSPFFPRISKVTIVQNK